MPQLVSVRFRFNPKPLWFDPIGQKYEMGTEVLVETERGREVGVIYEPAIEATDKQISKLKSPLKPVIRELTDLDYEHIDALEEKGKNAMPFFREKIKEYQLDIKPVEVQYLFSGERAIFYFSSEERVDFRELVRDLAQHFHVRIDMRQIGARDEAKELGGLAHCGEEFCCTRFGGEFQPVSIRMAKEQDLPLNPAKISGACGRLMCCLRYEYEAYKDFKKRAPKKGTSVDTPLGEAVISGYNTPRETMELKLEDGKRLNVPLAEMDCQKDKEGCTRCSVSNETIERCATRSMLIALGSFEHLLDESHKSNEEEIEVDLAVDTASERKRRRRSTKKSVATAAVSERASSGSAAQSSEEKPSQNTRRRRRRNTNSEKREQPSTGGKTQKSGGGSQPASHAKSEEQSSASKGQKPRPGQRSSGLRKPRNRSSAERSEPQSPSIKENTPAQETAQVDSRRRRRRRSSGGGGSSSSASSDNGTKGAGGAGNNDRESNSRGHSSGSDSGNNPRG